MSGKVKDNLEESGIDRTENISWLSFALLAFSAAGKGPPTIIPLERPFYPTLGFAAPIIVRSTTKIIAANHCAPKGDGTLTSDYEQLSLQAAEAIAAQIKAKPDCCLGLPSGRSPLGCYQLLSRWSQEGRLDWSAVRCFALDDYLDAEETKTFASFLHENLYKHTNLPLNQRFNPRFHDDYDGLIAGFGGLDLTMIGIGRNGHIAFNEPGTPRLSWTHCVWLEESTRQQNAAYFGSPDQVPKRAITMGLETIMQSRALYLLVSGDYKRDILKQAMSGNFTTTVPASCLPEHKRLTVLTDFAN